MPSRRDQVMSVPRARCHGTIMARPISGGNNLIAKTLVFFGRFSLLCEALTDSVRSARESPTVFREALSTAGRVSCEKPDRETELA
jgi:hypothetical protein